MTRKVTIRVEDHEDTTVVELPDRFYGAVEFSFQAGVLQFVKRHETKGKKELKNPKETHVTE